MYMQTCVAVTCVTKSRMPPACTHPRGSCVLHERAVLILVLCFQHRTTRALLSHAIGYALYVTDVVLLW
jgi:hypothetical protein